MSDLSDMPWKAEIERLRAGIQRWASECSDCDGKGYSMLLLQGIGGPATKTDCAECADIRALLQPASGASETLTWVSVSTRDSLPDSDTTVMTFGPQHEPVWLGWYDSAHEQWRDVGAEVIEVTYWAEMPEGPRNG